jgi:hypothetical protein
LFEDSAATNGPTISATTATAGEYNEAETQMAINSLMGFLGDEPPQPDPDLSNTDFLFGHDAIDQSSFDCDDYYPQKPHDDGLQLAAATRTLLANDTDESIEGKVGAMRDDEAANALEALMRDEREDSPEPEGLKIVERNQLQLSEDDEEEEEETDVAVKSLTSSVQNLDSAVESSSIDKVSKLLR